MSMLGIRVRESDVVTGCGSPLRELGVDLDRFGANPFLLFVRMELVVLSYGEWRLRMVSE